MRKMRDRIPFEEWLLVWNPLFKECLILEVGLTHCRVQYKWWIKLLPKGMLYNRQEYEAITKAVAQSKKNREEHKLLDQKIQRKEE